MQRQWAEFDMSSSVILCLRNRPFGSFVIPLQKNKNHIIPNSCCYLLTRVIFNGICRRASSFHYPASWVQKRFCCVYHLFGTHFSTRHNWQSFCSHLLGLGEDHSASRLWRQKIPLAMALLNRLYLFLGEKSWKTEVPMLKTNNNLGHTNMYSDLEPTCSMEMHNKY